MGKTLLEQLDPRIRQAILRQPTVAEVKKTPTEPLQYWTKYTDIDEKTFYDIVDIAAMALGATIADDKKPQFAQFTQMLNPECGYREWKFNNYVFEARRKSSVNGQYWVRFALIPTTFNPDHVQEKPQQREFREKTNGYFLSVNKAATLSQTY